MAKLTVDISPLLDDQWTGIPVFTSRLVKALLGSLGDELAFACGLSVVPPDHVLTTLRVRTGTFLRGNYERGMYAEVGLIDPAVPLLHPTVKHTPGVADREASSVHDMSTLFMPETHEEANIAHHLDVLNDELATDEIVFCVSEATRAALTLAFPSVAGRTGILYQYVDWPPEYERMDYNAPRMALPRYAVVVGTIEPRKNLKLLLDVLETPAIRKANLHFVVIGRQGWKVDSMLAAVSEKTKSHILFTGFVSEFTKYRLIRHCEFMVFPSLYEGFGIPALEAMSLGKPVLASFSSSFPEVIGDAGVFFDPLSKDEFLAGLERIEAIARLPTTPALALKLSTAFSPERMAAPVLKWIS